MATNYNIRLKRFNGTDYDNLYPNTIVDQVTGNWPTNRLSGTITKTQISPDATYTSVVITLSSGSWSNNSQNVSIPTSVGITANSLVIVSPTPNSFSAYGESGIYCSAQATNSLTFICESPPSANITVNIVKLT